jgi:transcriptional regulator with XRE-family HTH domain
MSRTQAHNRKHTPIRRAFGKIVREKRLGLGLSQEKLAEKADLHTNYVGSVERGERNIALENIYRLAAALECSPKELLADFD